LQRSLVSKKEKVGHCFDIHESWNINNALSKPEAQKKCTQYQKKKNAKETAKYTPTVVYLQPARDPDLSRKFKHMAVGL
jgi:hypothetical protein